MQKSVLEDTVKDINENFSKSKINKKVILYIEDTELKPDIAVSKLKNLVDRDIRIIIGPPTSSELNATMKYIDEKKIDVLLLSPSSTSPSLSKKDNIFRFVQNDTKQGKEIAEKMYNDGIRVVVPMLRTDSYGNELYNAMKINFEKLGGNVSTEIVKYNPHVGKFAGSLHRINFIMWNQELKDLSSLVSNAKQYSPSNSIGVYIIAFGEIVPILIQAQSYDNLSTVKWYGSDGTARNEHLLKHYKAREFANSTDFINPLMTLDEKNVKFELLEKNTKLELNIYNANAYDALWIAALTENISGNSTFGKLKENFNKIIESFQGASGAIKLDKNGDRFGNYDFWMVKENPITKDYEWEDVSNKH